MCPKTCHYPVRIIGSTTAFSHFPPKCTNWLGCAQERYSYIYGRASNVWLYHCSSAF